MLYDRLLLDGVFKNQAELAVKLGISSSTLNELMAFTRIPEEIASKIKNIHSLTIVMALKIVNLANESDHTYQRMIELASKIGESITNPLQLEKAINQKTTQFTQELLIQPRIYSTKSGKKLFSYKIDSKGNHAILINKHFANFINSDEICNNLKTMLESTIAE